tara:strand:- start:48 stop:299 length:252 start_codon:yes stop_codon:yes gene_type:complete
VRAEDVTFYVGDLLYDDTLGDVGILLERFDSHREYEDQPPSNVTVWRTFWCKAGWEEYSEFGLQSLVAMDVFTCYSLHTQGNF